MAEAVVTSEEVERMLARVSKGLPLQAQTIVSQPRPRVRLTVEPVSLALRMEHPDIFSGHASNPSISNPTQPNPIQLKEHSVTTTQASPHSGSSPKGKLFKFLVSVGGIGLLSFVLSFVGQWQKHREAEIGKIESANAITLAEADLIKAKADLIKSQAATNLSHAQAMTQMPSSGRALRPSDVPQHLRAETFSIVMTSVPCTVGGQGLESEGMKKPIVLSEGFELEPGKCFFAQPTTKPKQLEGHNAFMELYDPTSGSLKGRCDFTQAGMSACSGIYDQAIAGQGVIRFGARTGGFIKYWV